jgi:hypothetical protein
MYTEITRNYYAKYVGVSRWKVEANEDIYSTLEREIDEELGCRIKTSKEIFNNTIHEYNTFIINLLSIKCKVTSGNPTPVNIPSLFG